MGSLGRVLIVSEELQGRANQEDLETLGRLKAHNATPETRGQQTFVSFL
jgi:hypothetical protein